MERSAVETGSIPLESRVARVSAAEKKSLKLRLSYVGRWLYIPFLSLGEYQALDGAQWDWRASRGCNVFSSRRYCICLRDTRNKIERIWGIFQVCVRWWRGDWSKGSNESESNRFCISMGRIEIWGNFVEVKNYVTVE